MLGAARQGIVNHQGVRGELNPPPRPSQGRMLACYTTNTIPTAAVTREGLEPSRLGGHGLLRTACLPFHHLAIDEQWTVEGVEPSSAGCKPTIFPLDDTPVPRTKGHRAVCRAGVEPAQQSRVGYSHLGSPVPGRHVLSVPWMGFEPTLFTLRG